MKLLFAPEALEDINCYKLVYFIENDTVNVVSVFDCRQNPEVLKKRL